MTITDENYKIALDLLENEFLNKRAIFDDLFRKIIDIKPDFDRELLKTKIYINDIKCILSDLKTYGKDLLAHDASKELVSHIVFNKLPYNFRQELVRRLNRNYPYIEDIFTNYVDVVKTINLRGYRTYDKPLEKFKPILKTYDKKVTFNSPPLQQNSATVQNVEVKRNCKFCTATNHSMLNCRKFPSHESRMKRCRELNMCMRCSSLKHLKTSCNTPLDFSCVICQSKDHISALCPNMVEKLSTNLCLNSSNSTGNTYILPTINVKFSIGKNNIILRCLIDCGSQRSYVSEKLMKNLGFDKNLNEYLCV